jgi:DMSO/TMAO reductase YedYZ molybdopterin-dependent catalytic subunit
MRGIDRHRETVLSPEEARRELGRRSRRGFLMAGAAAMAGFAGYEWLTKAGDEDGAPWPQRRALDVNRNLGEAYLSDGHLMPSYPASQITYLKPNGDYGLNSHVDLKQYRVRVSTDNAKPFDLLLPDIMALPRIEMITRFCCIEGWSVITSWTGTRFSDFARKYVPPGKNLPPYVYLATPDGEYYVGLDIKSAVHPQTLLAYEQNQKPLAAEHGAPLRLVIPVKYGIKNIKRIGSIQFTSEKPDDYWAEQGYDWFAGL